MPDREDIDSMRNMIKEDVAVTELSNLLSIKLETLDEWEWKEDENFPRIGWQKFSNGKSRAFLYADIVDTLLIHVIGTR